VPGSPPELIPHEDDLDEDGDAEGDKGGDGANAEDGVDGGAAEDQKQQQDADKGVEPHGVHGRQRVPVHLLQGLAEHAEAVVAGVRETDARRRHHAALPHGESADDRQSEHGERGIPGQYLNQVGGPRLAELGVDDSVDVGDGICD